MKKILFMAAMMATVALTSCGGGSKEEETDTTQVQTEEEILVAEPVQEVADSANAAVNAAADTVVAVAVAEQAQ